MLLLVEARVEICERLSYLVYDRAAVFGSVELGGNWVSYLCALSGKRSRFEIGGPGVNMNRMSQKYPVQNVAKRCQQMLFLVAANCF